MVLQHILRMGMLLQVVTQLTVILLVYDEINVVVPRNKPSMAQFAQPADTGGNTGSSTTNTGGSTDPAPNPDGDSGSGSDE